MNGTISDGMIKKIAHAGLVYFDLDAAYQRGGSDGLKQLLSEKQENDKPRVTKISKIIDAIVTFFQKNKNSK